MRHGKKFNHLGRKTGHRRAMLANMACSLIEQKRITTTVAKAKALRQYVEPLITKSKDDSTHSRRVVFSYLQSKDAVTELFRDVAPKIAERPGGYTRILKTGNRLGDNADMCFIELVDFNETYVGGDKKEKKTTRRSRRGGSSAGTKAKTETPAADTVVAEEVKAEKAPEAEVEAAAEVVEVEKKEEVVEEPAAETTEEPAEKPAEVKAEAEAPAEEKAEEEKKDGEDSPEENKDSDKKE